MYSFFAVRQLFSKSIHSDEKIFSVTLFAGSHTGMRILGMNDDVYEKLPDGHLGAGGNKVLADDVFGYLLSNSIVPCN